MSPEKQKNIKAEPDSAANKPSLKSTFTYNSPEIWSKLNIQKMHFSERKQVVMKS